jgi:hypothetical protein
MGAVVAVEMVVSGAFSGPVVLLDVSLSTKDEPAFFRALVRLSSVLGSLPFALLAKVAASMVKRIPASPKRQEELRDDFRRNVPADVKDSASTWAGCTAVTVVPNGCARRASRCGSSTPRRVTED